MGQNTNISLSLGNRIDILNKTQSLDARYGVYDTEAEALLVMQSYGADGRLVAVYSDKPNGVVGLFLYNEVQGTLDPVGAQEQLTTDSSLYLDPNTSEIRSNVGQVTQTFTWLSGAQDFVLVDEPVRLIYIAVNGQLLTDMINQWYLDVPNKTLTILNTLDVEDIITINYQYLINP